MFIKFYKISSLHKARRSFGLQVTRGKAVRQVKSNHLYLVNLSILRQVPRSSKGGFMDKDLERTLPGASKVEGLKPKALHIIVYVLLKKKKSTTLNLFEHLSLTGIVIPSSPPALRYFFFFYFTSIGFKMTDAWEDPWFQNSF